MAERGSRTDIESKPIVKNIRHFHALICVTGEEMADTKTRIERAYAALNERNVDGALAEMPIRNMVQSSPTESCCGRMGKKMGGVQDANRAEERRSGFLSSERGAHSPAEMVELLNSTPCALRKSKTCGSCSPSRV
jgi:hypothetical protein